MDDKKIRALQEEWSEYKETHNKIIDTSVYDLFNRAILPTVKRYCSENENVEYQYKISEEEVSVIITSQKLMFDENDSEILRILPLADLVDIRPVNNMITMELWLRTWYWSPND